MFSCNPPPALLAQWPGSFLCYCSNMGMERIVNQKGQHRKLTLENESGTLTIELSQLPMNPSLLYTQHTVISGRSVTWGWSVAGLYFLRTVVAGRHRWQGVSTAGRAHGGRGWGLPCAAGWTASRAVRQLRDTLWTWRRMGLKWRDWVEVVAQRAA